MLVAGGECFNANLRMSKSDLTDDMVIEWRTTLFRSPLASAEPERSVNCDAVFGGGVWCEM